MAKPLLLAATAVAGGESGNEEKRYYAMNKNGFEVGGWQPKRECKNVNRWLYVLILIGVLALLAAGVFFSWYVYLHVQGEVARGKPAAVETPAARYAAAFQPRTASADTLTEAPTVLPASEASTALPTSEAPTAAPDTEPDYLILVNAQNPLPENTEPAQLISLEELESAGLATLAETPMLGMREAVEALGMMLYDAVEAGCVDWQINDAYRSISVQQAIWDKSYEKYLTENGLGPEKALLATQRRVAEPGASEHHTGLAFDLAVQGQSFRHTEQCIWIAENCWKYGFIVRYTEEKERITGISAEPWHIRYVGETAAKDIYEGGLCLEEYLQ